MRCTNCDGMAMAILLSGVVATPAKAAISGEELITVGTGTLAVTWVTDEAADTCVWYGTGEDLDQQACDDGPATRFHYLAVSGLSAVPFVETVSTKEYPGGYALYDVYSEGYVQTTWRTHCAECLEWFEMTKGEYGGHAYEWQFGTLEDRNFTVTFEPIVASDPPPEAQCGGCGMAGTRMVPGMALATLLALLALRRAGPRRC